ncbi:MAG: hypothetical protein ACRDYU_03805 [Actinomycetes bacterium]
MLVTFERIGRTHVVEPLIVDDGSSKEQIEAAVLAHARPYLVSRGVDVVVEPGLTRGVIFCGLRNGGQFTIQRDSATQEGAS